MYGFKKNVAEKSFYIDYYKDCLFSQNDKMRTMNVIRSRRHELLSEKVNKTAFFHELFSISLRCPSDAAQRVSLCRHMWFLSPKAEEQTRPDTVQTDPCRIFVGRLVALLMSAHTLCYCHIKMLLFKCCQPLVANCTPFFSVTGQFFKSVERDPAFTLGRLNVVLETSFLIPHWTSAAEEFTIK